jgi:hypothetical protein
VYSITVITYVPDYCISITKMSDTCTLSQLCITHLGDTDTVVRDIGDKCDREQVSLILVILIQYSKREIGDNCDRVQVSLISITKMSDTCTLSQLSPMSLTIVSVSPR